MNHTHHQSSIIHTHIQPPLPKRSNLTNNQHNLPEQLNMFEYGYGGPYKGGASGGGAYEGGAYGGGSYGGQNGGPFQNPNGGYQTPNPQSTGQGLASGQQFRGGYNLSNNYNPLNQGPQYAVNTDFTPQANGEQARVMGRLDRGSYNNQFLSGTGRGVSIAGGGQYPDIGTSKNGPFPLPRGRWRIAEAELRRWLFTNGKPSMDDWRRPWSTAAGSR